MPYPLFLTNNLMTYQSSEQAGCEKLFRFPRSRVRSPGPSISQGTRWLRRPSPPRVCVPHSIYCLRYPPRHRLQRPRYYPCQRVHCPWSGCRHPRRISRRILHLDGISPEMDSRLASVGRRLVRAGLEILRTVVRERKGQGEVWRRNAQCRRNARQRPAESHRH